ncbi:MAG: reverse transcriptase family protein, partial [Candidatus Thiodiazotropha sp.]
MTWNCNGLSDEKCESEEFCNILRDNAIVFLLESWTSEYSNLDFEGYKVYNFYRKFRHRRAKRRSGGVVLLYRENLHDGIKVVRNSYDTIIWIKLDGNYFSFENDIYICGAYMWGDTSPMYNIAQCDLFQTLENDIAHFDQLGSVIVCGDFNGRIANKLDYIDHDVNNHSTDSNSYEPDIPLLRTAIDTVSNNQGAQLLDLCKSTTLRIANGRLDGNSNFTYFCRTGSSVIDYLLLKQDCFSYINTFVVREFNEFSDHAPLQFSLHACHFETCFEEPTDEDFYKYTWNPDNRDEFRRRLISLLPDMNAVFENVNRHEKKSVNEAVYSFVDIINDAAEPLFKRKVTETRSKIFKKTVFAKSNWFDNECMERKNEYKEALLTFNISKSAENRKILCDKKKLYKDTIRRKKRLYKYDEMKKIELLKGKRPKDFWKLFSKAKSNSGKGISVNEFFAYFKNLVNEINVVRNDEAEYFCANNDFDMNDPIYEELDSVITPSEIEACIKSLKHGKACGADNLLNEYFLEAGDILLSHLTELFNLLLDTGCFPESWADGIIIPLFKKGNVDDVSNYRGITLVSCLSKLFTAVLNHRIMAWCDKNSKISDAQFGFRKGFSTVDAIFTLHSLIENMINSNKRLYCAFVDMKKAFDSVYRNALWLKLFKLGINGKMLRMMRSMYDTVKCCVRHCSAYSDFFEVGVGLKQGETMSPILFSLFVEDLELYLQSKPDSGITINDINLVLLFFADDMAIL